MENKSKEKKKINMIISIIFILIGIIIINKASWENSNINVKWPLLPQKCYLETMTTTF